MIRYVPLTVNDANSFDRACDDAGDDLKASSLSTIQVNIGLVCNLACHHCHVESHPKRTEEMAWPTMRRILEVAKLSGASTIDITGGAPEMNPHFRAFVQAARQQGLKVMVRTNLTIMLVEGYQDLPQWYADQGVELIASLPCYLPENVNKQRGRHVYEDSVEVIKKLNQVGYGHEEALVLNLVYNPLGPSLPPEQASLETDYKRILAEDYGIYFNQLFTITNLPIGRFLHDLERDGKAVGYMQLLQDRFNAGTLGELMCRHQLHVSYDGSVHDCDFNYALDMPVSAGDEALNINDLDIDAFLARRIRTGEHCFGCTAGSGSSCGGALA